jgi:hypothetical protein
MNNGMTLGKMVRIIPIPTAAPAKAIVAAPAPIDLAPSNMSSRDMTLFHAFPSLLEISSLV